VAVFTLITPAKLKWIEESSDQKDLSRKLQTSSIKQEKDCKEKDEPIFQTK